MIFSNQALHTAFAYKSAYYNKILLINLDDGSFKPIKVDDDEWMQLDKTYNFTSWVREFAESNRFIAGANCGQRDFIIFNDVERLKTLSRPDSIKYYKNVMVKDFINPIHEVITEFIPVDEHSCYIFVKDLDKEITQEDSYGIREQ